MIQAIECQKKKKNYNLIRITGVGKRGNYVSLCFRRVLNSGGRSLVFSFDDVDTH